MKNFKLNAVKLGRKTNTGKRIYVLSGSKASLDFYREQQGEYLREDDNGRPLFFTMILAQAGTITYNEVNDRFYLESDFASEVMMEAAMRTFRVVDSAPVDSAPTSSSEEDNEEPEIEAPKAAKPTSGKRSLKTA